MKKIIIILLAITHVYTVNAQNIREKICIDNNWKFALGHAADANKDFHFGQSLTFSKTAYLQETTLLTNGAESRFDLPYMNYFKDSAWEAIDLPHDWAMRLPYDKNDIKTKGYRKIGGRSPENSVGWYRKNISFSESDKSKRIYLEFDGVFRDARVWINGVYLGRHESGYTGFSFDVTELVNYNDNNVICVRVDATHSELWSYEGAGIYRHVYIEKTPQLHFADDGVYVRTISITDRKADIIVGAEITNDLNTAANNTALTCSIYDKFGQEIAKSLEFNIPVINPLEVYEAQVPVYLKDPIIWSLEKPELLVAVVHIKHNSEVVDETKTTFGIRTIDWDAKKGFFLNGKRVQLQGVCCHQDHAGVGIAVPDKVQDYRILQLKKIGTNALRTSHNPPGKELLDACDKYGMLVMDETRMMSSSEEGLDQLKRFIRRDRNHPSVIIWSLGNEEPSLQGSVMGQRVMSRMKAVQQQLDPTRKCTAAMNGDWGKGITEIVDVQGCNYFRIGDVDVVYAKHPDQPIMLSEEASTLSTRSEYESDPVKSFYQSYDIEKPDWGATAKEWLSFIAKRPFLAGAFVWTGLDYGGESIMYLWPAVSSHFGILDYCGFPKDLAYYYKAWWTNETVLHILPHWNWKGKEGKDIKVQCFTNCDEVELFLNGKSLGSKKLAPYDQPEWIVKYKEGTLKAVGIKNGKKVIEEVTTTGEVKKLVAETLENTINKDNNDVAVINIKAVDKKGITVPEADNKLLFYIENGKVTGVGNGNPSSQEADQFKAGEIPYRKLFHGLAQLIVKPDTSGKPMKVIIKSDNLPDEIIVFTVK
ncbi:MAG: beta-galactosidase GalA [Bacteroidota bacterium]